MSAIVFLIAFCMALCAVAWIVRLVDRRSMAAEQRYLEEGRCIKGVVSRIDHEGMARPNHWIISAKYEIDGVAHYAASGRLPFKPACGVGDPITVRVMPSHPGDGVILEMDVR